MARFLHRYWPVCLKRQLLSKGWKDWRNRQSGSHDNEIYGYDISTGEEFAIDTSVGVKDGLVSSGNYVVWCDGHDRNDTVDDNVTMQYDIYSAVLTKQ